MVSASSEVNNQFHPPPLVEASGQDSIGRCYWLALLERNYNGLDREIWLIMEKPDGTTRLVGALAGRYDLAECSFAVTAVVSQAQVHYRTARVCFDENQERVVQDTVVEAESVIRP